MELLILTRKTPLKRALFIFRRDLRLQDNTGLIFALQQAEEVIPAFIFSPEQTKHHAYFSQNCFDFMIGCLKSLHEDLKNAGSHLYLFEGHPEEIVQKCIHKLEIDGVIVNEDYTPYSQKRDQKLSAVCKKNAIPFHSFEDLLLHPKELTCKKDGNPYTIFTPFYKHAKTFAVAKPVKNLKTNYYHKKIDFEVSLPKHTELGGRKQALELLRKAKNLSYYETLRDIPSKDYSTHLSPHLKFTTCSPREVYAAVQDNEPLVRALYWRDFFTLIGFYFPHVFKGAFREEFNAIAWKHNKDHFQAWCNGMTGFPIVDAGMRQLNATGTMHNRVRMITASFLIKDLHIDWREGEKYFAQKLLDYDPALNNGNWQWVASTGTDAQPYFRIFNPWSQQKRFDPDCLYIKTWVEELKHLSAKEIHFWGSQTSLLTSDYPLPIVDHTKEAKVALKAYQTHTD